MPSILITGANRGIGLEFAKQYAAEGWRVLAVCRDPEGAAELRRLAADRRELSLHRADIADPAAIGRLAQDLNGAAIDILLNNAGIAVRDGASFAAVKGPDWLQGFAVNTIAPALLSQALLANVMAGERKVIAMLSSRLGSLTHNTGGFFAYRATKAALNSVVRSMAAELRSAGITCLALHPGHVRTDMGGAAAPVLPADSVRGLRRVLAAAGPATSGGFLDFTGATIEW